MAERPPSNPFGPSDLIYGVKDPTPQDIADVINDYSGVVSDAAILTQERLDIFARKNVEKGEVAENQRSSSAWGKGWENFGIELGYDPPSRDLQIFINEVIGAPERDVGDRIFDAGLNSIDFQRTVQNVRNRRQQLQSEQSTPTLDVLRSRAGIAQNSIADIISMMRGGLEQPTDEDPPMDEGLGERLLKSRQATRVFGGVPPKKPATLPVPRLATAIQKRGRGLIRKLPQFRIALALQDIWESFPEETQAEILTTVQISPSEMEQINQLPHWPEIGSPLSPEVADLIVAKIDEVGKEAWDWFEGLVGRGEEPEPTGIATLEPAQIELETIRNNEYKQNAEDSVLYQIRPKDTLGFPTIFEIMTEKGFSSFGEVMTSTGANIDKNITVAIGQRIAVRPNLNIRRDTGVTALSIHDKNYSGTVLANSPAATITDVSFMVGITPQMRVAVGDTPKTVLSSVNGNMQSLHMNEEPINRDGITATFNPKTTHLYVTEDGRAVKRAGEATIENNKVFLRGEVEYYSKEELNYIEEQRKTISQAKNIDIIDSQVQPFAVGGLVQGPFPRATSRFAAHAGFVDKPLYSRS